jgi:RNA polymerase sigma-70 factor (ECF subfamily)
MASEMVKPVLAENGLMTYDLQPSGSGLVPKLFQKKENLSVPPTRDSMSPQAGDLDWITVIRNVSLGDQAALSAFYDATHRIVFAVILRVLNDRASSEEVLLDVYTQVWRQAANYDTGRGSPLAWLMTIARSRAIDRLRSGWQEQHRSEPLDSLGDARSGGESPEESAAFAEKRRIVRSALGEIPAQQRELIEMAFYSGLSHSEIAEKSGIPLGTVKTRIRLGMMKLKDLLGPSFGGAA